MAGAAPSALERLDSANLVKFPNLASFPVWEFVPGKHRELS
jgi:hypothetical protein